MLRKGLLSIATVSFISVMAFSSPQDISWKNRKKIRAFEADSAATSVGLPPEKMFKPQDITSGANTKKDTIKIVNFEGKEQFLFNTIVDDSGETVANQVLESAVVTARFRHIAERNGKVDLEFQIVVPEKMLDENWQLRYEPTMYVLKDSVKLDKIFITGQSYRKKQLRGYEQYNKFLSRIITDSTKFIDLDRLNIFIQRNLPEIYAFRSDSTYVSDETFEGFMGVTEREAIEHYTKHYLIRWNDSMVAKKGKKYRQYVKAPLVTESLRLDTVITVGGNYVYNYVQELDLKGKRRLKKVDIVLDGQIYEQGDKIYDIPRTEPLTFYISSISAFVDGTERYITKIIERRATANRDYNIDFHVGKYDVDQTYGDNASQISLIKSQLMALIDNDKFDLDSVVVAASASPEGSVVANRTLSQKRSDAISAYFNRYMKAQIDSLNSEDGLSFNLDDSIIETGKKEPRRPISFKSHAIAENWEGLNSLIERDTVLTVTDKEDYYALCDIADLDEREHRMKKEPWYKHMRENVYPHLRTVKFNFILHRKGMVKDTLHTTEIDSVYMDGVQAIRDRDYELAASLLAPYNDYNTAIAYSALDRNHSALEILKTCKATAEVNYMLAIIYSRFGDDQKAVQAYMDACKQNGSYVHRGNLDPEISALIKKYDLNKQEEEFDF